MSSRPKFTKNNATKFAVVHRPHDDPNFYDADASERILVPVHNPNLKREKPQPKYKPSFAATAASKEAKKTNEHVGEAALYGITFDDSKYDYTQHLKPIGMDPANAVFIPAKTKKSSNDKKYKDPESMFVEPAYRELENKKSESMFVRGVAKPEYLQQMQNIPDELAGFKPDMNPALREVLEALEDDAYVVNDDIVVDEKATDEANEREEDDDIFAELLHSGRAEGVEEFEDDFDEWDMDNLNNYEDEHYKEEMAQFESIDKLEDLQGIDVSADVRRFKLQNKKNVNDWDSDNDFSDADSMQNGLGDEEEEDDLEKDQENDVLGDLPSFNKNAKTGSKARKQRRKKGAMSDVSGFSMTSSAIARTEVMTVLDDKYDQIIGGYENYEEEQEEEEEKYESFDMSKERPDFEDMLDEFLDTYELGSGGRKLVKKDKEIDRLKEAADEVSKGKLSMRRKREQAKKSVNGITNGISSLKF